MYERAQAEETSSGLSAFFGWGCEKVISPSKIIVNYK